MPLVNHDLKLIFTHIPKTGGGSFRNAITDGYNVDNVGGKLPQDGYHGIIKEDLIQQYPDYHKVVIVRNPFTAAVSGYRMKLFEAEKKGLTYMSFTNWLETRNSNGFFNQLEYVLRDDKLIVDTIIKYETLEEDIENLNNKIGVNIQLPKKKVHFYGNYNWKDYYSEYEKDLVEKLAGPDIKYFKYNFE